MGQLICGRNSVMDAIKNGLPLRKIFLTKIAEFDTGKTEVKIITRREMDTMTRENHQGYVAELVEVNIFGLDEVFKDKPQKVLILDHIQDPHNFGAILRSANASGVKHIIIPKERAVGVTATVLKVASGGNVGVKIIRVGSLTDAVQKLKKQEFWIYATALEGGVKLEHASFNKPLVLIVGNEGKGVARPLLKLADQKVFIDMKGTVQSLNVSVATGIILFKL